MNSSMKEVDPKAVSILSSPPGPLSSSIDTGPELLVPREIHHEMTPSLSMIKHRGALPTATQDHCLEWKGVNVYVGTGKKRKQIIHDFNGAIRSGQLLALMGGSGAGKTTFLNVLSGRTNLSQMTVDGQLGLDGFKFPAKNQNIIRSVCSYVPQSDILCPTQTVEEALTFYARLKLHKLSRVEQEKRVNHLIAILKLEKCRNTPIGGETKRGVSGGEKRRVSIAAEILNDTDIIFLDEPTSGLDAYTAARTIKVLKEFCSVSNKIIIATIHQPAMEVFYLFDRLILLSAGKCCFNSDLEDIDIYFRDQLRPKTNPADVILFEVQQHPDECSKEWEGSSLNNTKDSVRGMVKYETLTFDDLKKGNKLQELSTNITLAPTV